MASSDNIRKKLEIVSRKQQYKALIDRGNDISKRIETSDILESFQNIMEIVKTCDSLGAAFVTKGKAENASEYLLDAQVIKMSHDLMGSTAEKLGNAEFSDREFQEALINFLTVDTGYENFDKLAEEAVMCCMSVRYSIPLLGTFEREERQIPEKGRKERQKRQKNTDELKKPENIAALKKSDKGAEKINSYHIQIEKICQTRPSGLVPYYELISDPTDFMLTVDNAFQISFLVRDGLIGLKRVNGEPHVYVIANPVRPTQTQGATTETVQCVSSINPKVWRENVEKYRITSPLLIQNMKHSNNESLTQTQIMDTDSDSSDD